MTLAAAQRTSPSPVANLKCGHASGKLLDRCLALKAEWLISIGSILHRFEENGTIDQDEYRRCRVTLSKRRWTKREPMDDVIPVEKPELFRKCEAKIGKSLGASQTQIAAEAPIPQSLMSEISTL